MIALVADHVWQSTIVAAVAALLARALRRNRPQVRYALWLAASAKFLVPFAALLAAGAQVGGRSGGVAAPALAVVIDSWDAIGQPFSRPAPVVAPPAMIVASAVRIVLLAVWDRVAPVRSLRHRGQRRREPVERSDAVDGPQAVGRSVQSARAPRDERASDLYACPGEERSISRSSAQTVAVYRQNRATSGSLHPGTTATAHVRDGAVSSRQSGRPVGHDG